MLSPLAPTLIGCSHGTADPAGREAIASILVGVRALRPGLDVREAYVDVQTPEVDDVVIGALADHAHNGAHDDANNRAHTGDTHGDDAPVGAVVVPLLLSAGFHTYVDIVRAVNRPGARAGHTLGPDVRLTQLLVERLREAGADKNDTIVLAAAGSSDARTVVAVERVLAQLREAWDGPVEVGYGAMAKPTVPDAVAAARAGGASRVVIASYLLAPGHFHNVLCAAGADVVTAPLAPHALLADIVLDRFDDAVSGVGVLGSEEPLA